MLGAQPAGPNQVFSTHVEVFLHGCARNIPSRLLHTRGGVSAQALCWDSAAQEC